MNASQLMARSPFICTLIFHHYEKLHTLLSSLKVKPKTLAISESRIRKDRLFPTLALRITLMNTPQQNH